MSLRKTAPVDVLVLWQGTTGRSYAKACCRVLRRQRHEQRTIEPKRVGFGVNATFAHYWDTFAELASQAELAIAFVTRDKRPAERTGNLWLEVGYWLARHEDKKSILVLVDGRRTMPSDLMGYHVHPLSRSSLSKEVTDFVADALARLKPPDTESPFVDGEYNPVRRIRDTLGQGRFDCLPPQAARRCHHKHRNECAYRWASLSFISELLRMGRSNWEMSQVSTLLANIGKSADLVARQIPPAGQGLPTAHDGLQELLRHLARFGDRSLRRVDGHGTEAKGREDWECVKDFLSYRAGVASELLEHLPPAIMSSIAAGHKNWPPAVDKFIRLAKTIVCQRSRVCTWQQAHDLVESAEAITCALSFLSGQYFEECREAIRRNSGRRLSDAADAFGRIRNALPHNRAAEADDKAVLRIWPRPPRRTQS
jgi:hypothetical protein